MLQFLDFPGASGVPYRFHQISDVTQLPAIAGNFVYVRGEGRDATVVACGTDETLLRAADRWSDAVREHAAEAIYIRRNISWKTRAHEHADLVQQHHPAMVISPELERQA